MQFLLVKISTLAVMFHMAFGCVWHHGHVGSHVCMKDDTNESCCDHHNESHGHDAENSPTGPREHAEAPCDLNTSPDCGDLHGDKHFCCHDDSCKYSQDIDFDCDEIMKLTEYLGGVLNSSVKTTSFSPIVVWQMPTAFRLSAPGLRAHLYLCVQLL